MYTSIKKGFMLISAPKIFEGNRTKSIGTEKGIFLDFEEVKYSP